MEVALSAMDVARAFHVLFLAGVAVGLVAVLVAELIPSVYDPVVSPALFVLGVIVLSFPPLLIYFLMRGLARNLLVVNTYVLISFFFSRLRLSIAFMVGTTVATIVLCVLYPQQGLPYALFGAGVGIIGTLTLLWNEMGSPE